MPARRAPATNPDRPAPATFVQADQALRRLARNAARQRAAQKAAQLSKNGAGADGAARSGPPAAREAQGGQDGEKGRGKAPAAAAQRTGEADSARTATAAGPALRPVPATAAAIAPSRPAASRATGGFDFFGNATGPRQPAAPLEEDLADVVGEEALAEQSARTQPAEPAAAEDTQTDGATTTGSGEVIDLTAHDETEQLDLAPCAPPSPDPTARSTARRTGPGAFLSSGAGLFPGGGLPRGMAAARCPQGVDGGACERAPTCRYPRPRRTASRGWRPCRRPGCPGGVPPGPGCC
ncbi:hypothetical protein [Streptomyces lydicamycinicus]|uniref:hypothetical protein n=1 Tax=Streptomyces lydicamycinicus TaxID=1546107 RepID=UPI003D804862